MTNIKRKEHTNLMMDITERTTVMKNNKERSAIMYFITEQYGMWNRNNEHYGTTVMLYIPENTIMTYITDL